MKFVDFQGDNRLRHKIVYKKGYYSECVYCGRPADTREHTPSKVFLDKPYPEQLGIVPACYTCNNSFSKDELLFSLLIEKFKCLYYGKSYIPSQNSIARLEKYSGLADKIQSWLDNKNYYELGEVIHRILFKLAIGHSVFEVSEGYCVQEGTVKYSFIDSMSAEQIEEFSAPFNIAPELFPEMGSRIYDRMMVIQVLMSNDNNPDQKKKVRLFLLDWVVVQDSKYEYTCFSFPDKIVVKIIIHDFLFAEVHLGR